MAECFSFRFCCRWVMAFCERWWTNTKEGICRKLGKGGVRDRWMDGWMDGIVGKGGSPLCKRGMVVTSRKRLLFLAFWLVVCCFY